MTARPLTSDQRTITAIRLRAIADQLDADHAQAVQRNLAAAADPTPWPTTTSGATGTGGGTTSPVELATLATPAPTMARAARLLAELHRLATLAIAVDHGLAEWSPVRTIARCPNPGCNEPLRPDKRCPNCSQREGARQPCDDCGRNDADRLLPWPPSNWTGWTDGEQYRVCMADYKWRRRHDGRPKLGAERLALRDVKEAG